jgi:hypothetical protein
LTSFGCSSIEPLHDEGVGRTRAGDTVSFDVSVGGTERRELRLRARWSERETILAVPVLSQKVGFYDSQGAALPSNRHTSLPSLVGASAEAVEKSSVLIGFRAPGAGLRGHHTERTFERSLPFSQIKDDVERLFATSDDLDAEVKVEALHAGVAASTLFVRRFDLVLAPGRHGEVILDPASVKRLSHHGPTALAVVGRPFKDFGASDRPLESYMSGSTKVWVVPDGDGPWFVYATIEGDPPIAPSPRKPGAGSWRRDRSADRSAPASRQGREVKPDRVGTRQDRSR